jgi:hypothetical protein
MDVGDSANAWPAFAAFPRSPSEAHEFWRDVVRLVELDAEPLLDALDDLINSDIIGPETVPLDVLAVVFITVWGHCPRAATAVRSQPEASVRGT